MFSTPPVVDQVVEAQGVQINTPGTELFVRLRLGSATQFTHPRPVSYPAVSWQQDFVFVKQACSVASLASLCPKVSKVMESMNFHC